MKCVNIDPFDLYEKEIGDGFQQNFVDFEKKKMAYSVIGVLKQFAKISNSNIIKNVDALLTKIPVDSEIKRVGKNCLRMPENKFKVSFLFLHYILCRLKFGR